MKEAKILARKLFLASKDIKREEMAQAVKKFIGDLKEKRKLFLLSAIVRELALIAERNKATITLSRELEDKVLEVIKNNPLVNKIIKEKPVDVKFDKKLIAGFMVRTEDYLLDASLRGILHQLKSNL